MRIFFIVFTSLGLLGAADPKTEANDWVAMPPQELMPIERRGAPLPSADVHEVVTSTLDPAVIKTLQSQAFVPLTEFAAKKYTAGRYSSEKNKKPYLVRALYINYSTGGFLVYKLKNNIWVFHGCTGGGGGLHKTALIVNLDFVPEKVYVTAFVSDL